jgi:hypothetical protein
VIVTSIAMWLNAGSGMAGLWARVMETSAARLEGWLVRRPGV